MTGRRRGRQDHQVMGAMYWQMWRRAAKISSFRLGKPLVFRVFRLEPLSHAAVVPEIH
jgi:hypothetical protein